METILIPGAEIYYDKNFLSPEEATSLFNVLRTKCAWERRKSSFKYAVPRDEAYYGDSGTNYTYSRREYKPLSSRRVPRVQGTGSHIFRNPRGEHSILIDERRRRLPKAGDRRDERLRVSVRRR